MIWPAIKKEVHRATLAISPCPNDTYMFDALIHQRLRSQKLVVDTSLHDIEELNQKALKGTYDITKMSAAHYPFVEQEYQLLTAGAAVGYGNGPLLIAREKLSLESLPGQLVAIPGRQTTANLLFSIAFPEVQNKIEMLFADIDLAVYSGRADAGLLIHETRFTYKQRGLVKLLDLGTWWEQHTRLPVPLGVIGVRRSLPEAMKTSINKVVAASVEHALQYPAESQPFIRKHASTLDAQVCASHIKLYVNDFSVKLGDNGSQAILKLFQEGNKVGILPPCTLPVFAKE